MNFTSYDRFCRRVFREVDGPLEQNQDIITIDQAMERHGISEHTGKFKKFKYSSWNSGDKVNSAVQVVIDPSDYTPTPEEYAETFLKLVQQTHKPRKVKAHKDKSQTTGIISIVDPHLGKETWSEKVGADTEYTIHDAVVTYLEAVQYLLDTKQVDSYVFPLLGDTMNVDTLLRTTTRGTPQENVDTKMMYKITLQTIIEAIDMIAARANVHVPVISGNHDELLSYTLGLALQERYRNDDRVTIDSSASKFKIVEQGSWAALFCHGDNGKAQDLAWAFPQRFPEVWGRSKYRIVYSGHLHHKKVSDEFKAVRIHVLPSLSKADTWHSDNHYISRRTATMHVLSAINGEVSDFYYNPA